MLEDILPHHTALHGFEVSHDFESIGPRTMLLNARWMENGPGVQERIDKVAGSGEREARCSPPPAAPSAVDLELLRLAVNQQAEEWPQTLRAEPKVAGLMEGRFPLRAA